MAGWSFDLWEPAMKTRNLIIPALLCLLVVGIPTASEASETPAAALRRTNRTLKTLLKVKVKKGSPQDERNKEKIKRTINAFLDFEELAKRALARHWDKRSTSERAEFVRILRELIERNYLKQLTNNLDYALEYRKESISGSTAQVLTAIAVDRDGRKEEVLIEYRMRRGAKGWMVFDVVTDDVSVVRNYRAQFNRIIKRNSYQALVNKMRRKLETI
jgi:phospholipid transport system substrate-binding protein